MFKVSESDHFSSYEVGLRSGSSASHILDQINLSEIKYPLDEYKTFNEFFLRELKPGAGPITSIECDEVAVSGAYSRFTAFETAADSMSFWNKLNHVLKSRDLLVKMTQNWQRSRRVLRGKMFMGNWRCLS